MPAYGRYLLKRLGQFALVVFIGLNITYIVSHATPIDPVEQTVAAVTNFGNTSPAAIEDMRQSLRELYGVGGNPLQQYLGYWWRVLRGDFGPSLSAFPTPVSTLIGRALPWTVGLLLVSTVLAWVIGNVLGALAGYFPRSRSLRLFGVLAMGLHPIPYYIVAFVLLILFGFVWPVLPITGGSGMNIRQEWSAQFILSVLRHSILPALSLVLVGIGGWFVGMRALVSNVVTEDYVTYAELAGVPKRRILSAYVMRSAMAPQLTGLAMSLGAIFNGAIITEQVFGYPGVGTLLVEAVHKGDYSLVLGIATVSIVAVAAAVLVIDLLHPLIDPRVRSAEATA
ncbi:ABC transporter permease [Falsiroseomonas sp. HW251]|uniref:ABC transporter permease n=1 Tax=Falsiroseomonas sp. HW251 TaxID=3390998 RepID=UPI003D3233EB